MKKKTQTYWRKRGSDEAKKQCREKVKFCEICGRKNCFLQGHHILSEGAYPQMSNRPENIIVVCSDCHLWGKVSFHHNGLAMREVFDKKFPSRYKELQISVRKRQGKVNYEKEYKELLKNL